MRFHSPIARIAAVAGLLALSAPGAFAKAAPAKRAAPQAPMVSDNAPFWTGKPNAAQWKARNERRIALAQAALDRLLEGKGAPTIANTLTLYDEINRQLDMAGTQSGLIEEVSPDSATRATTEELGQDISKFATDLSLNRQVYDALSAMDLTGADDETKYYVQRTLRDFRLSGVDKDEATRDKIRKLNEELVLISQE